MCTHNDPNEFTSHALWLLLLTGLRRNEILAAKWADIDWDNKTLYIGKTKNGESVLTALSRAAIARLKIIPRLHDNPYIICGELPGMPPATIDRMWRRVREETGFRDLRIHDLRRTVGSWLVRDGASLHLVGAVLNHRNQATTAGYACFQTEDRHKALDRHGKKVVGIAAGTVDSRKKSAPTDLPHKNAPAQNMPKVRRLSRQELHELIWSEPITTLAKRFGISDRGLTKVCKRSDIPTPPRGYWAKKQREFRLNQSTYQSAQMRVRVKLHSGSTENAVPQITSEPDRCIQKVTLLRDSDAIPISRWDRQKLWI